MARAPYDARTRARARGVSVQRGSLSPLCDTSFAEAVAPAPDAGAKADDTREGDEAPDTRLSNRASVRERSSIQ